MLSTIIWGILATFSFALFFTLPAGPYGTNYIVLVPGFIALTASILQGTQFRNRARHRFAVTLPTSFDDSIIKRAEKIKNDKWQEQDQMLKRQSSRRRAVRR